VCQRFEAAGSCRHFFHQRCILLRHAVHFRDGITDLTDTPALLVAGGTDLTHQVGHPFDGAHHLRHGAAGLVHQQRALRHTVHTVADQRLDFLGGVG